MIRFLREGPARPGCGTAEVSAALSVLTGPDTEPVCKLPCRLAVVRHRDVCVAVLAAAGVSSELQPPLGSATEISSLAPCRQSLWVKHSLQRAREQCSVALSGKMLPTARTR